MLHLSYQRVISGQGKKGWRKILRRFISYPITFLKNYFRRNVSEPGFSSGKRFPEEIMIIRGEKGFIHNLMLKDD